MAGRLQLKTEGVQDVFFTDDPEYTYFVKDHIKHKNFSIFNTDLDVSGEIEFNNTLECTIPQNQGDLVKNISVKIELNPIPQNHVGSPYVGFGYLETIGHAMIEYAQLYIGSELIQHIDSDFLEIYSENFVTQTKQENLSKLIGKPPLEKSGTEVSDTSINSYLGFADTSNAYPKSFTVNLPFYFHNNPELAIPICAITQQEIKVVLKLRDVNDCIYGRAQVDSQYYNMYCARSPKGLIKKLKISTEMIELIQDEREKIKNSKINHIITQVQQNKRTIPAHPSSNTVNQTITHRLNFKNPVKELFFVIQRKNNRVLDSTNFTSTFDYDLKSYQTLNGEYLNYESLRNLELSLDDRIILNEKTGDVINLRAIQSGIHHSRTQLFRRFYSYSFALEPERWYPTGQVNFSLIKDQNIKLNLNPDYDQGIRELRVYALSYNILRIENGIATTLFNL